MKLSKEDFKKKIDEKITDDDLKIELLEDIEDSIDVEDNTEKVEKTAYDELQTKYEELKTKYKERFLESTSEDTDEDKEDDEVKEEEIIDVKEI